MTVGGRQRMTGAVLALAAAVLAACASSAEQPAAAEAAGAPGGGISDAAAADESADLIAVTGRVVVTGSDPLVILVIVTDVNEQFELVGEPADPLWDLQQRRATVRGRVVREAAGPGFPAQLAVDSYTLVRP